MGFIGNIFRNIEHIGLALVDDCFRRAEFLRSRESYMAAMTSFSTPTRIEFVQPNPSIIATGQTFWDVCIKEKDLSS